MKAIDILIYILECGEMIQVDREFMSNVSKAVEELEELEEHISGKDDQIKWLREELKHHEAELEALQQHKSCEGCKYLYINKHSEFVEYCTDLNIEIPYSDITTFCCNRYEPKDNQ